MIDLKNQLAWYEARDYLHGCNGKPCSQKMGYDIAKTSNHPDAVWLVDFFDRASKFPDHTAENFHVDVYDGVEMKSMLFCELGTYFGGHRPDWQIIKHWAEQGHPLAQAVYSEYCPVAESFTWAKQSADQGEREGFYKMYKLHKWSLTTEESLGYLDKAVALNHGKAMIDRGMISDIGLVLRFEYMERAASIGVYDGIIETLYDIYLAAFGKESSHANHVYLYGQYLKIIWDQKDREWPITKFQDGSIRPSKLIAHKLIRVHDMTNRFAVEAVDATSMALKNMYGHLVCKDIRIMIARMIWKERSSWVDKAVKFVETGL